MKRLKLKKRFKILVLGFIILVINLKVAVPRLIENYNLKQNELLVENYIQGYSKNITGSPRAINIASKVKEKYIGILEIPAIKLKQGLVSPYSRLNNVNKNIEIIKPYHMPNEKGKIMILASHSGTSKVAFFNKLRYLNLNDLVYVYYKDIKYKYQVIDKYQIKKTGHLNLTNDKKDTLLVLITCNPNNLKKQIVVICKKFD